MTSPVECTECWCLVTSEMERAHADWHVEQRKTLMEVLKTAGVALEDVARLRMKITEMEGNTP